MNMSIRSRVAAFEARNQELRKEVVPVTTTTDKGDNEHTNMTEQQQQEQPRIITPSSSVAGRFGSTSIRPLHLRGTAVTAGGERTKAPPADDDVEDDHHIEEPPRVKRYQPLHQQYHQRQAQQRYQRQQQQQQESTPRDLSPPGGAEEQGEMGQRGGGMPQRRPQQHQHRRLEQMRRLEESQRRLHEHQQNRQPDGDRYHLPDARRKVSRQQQQQQQQNVLEQQQQLMKTNTTAQRLAKIQRMQRNRSLEKVRRNHQATRLEEGGYEQRPPSPGRQQRQVPLSRDLTLQPSAADDEITLTSVRQIVGTATSHESTSSAPSASKVKTSSSQQQQQQQQQNAYYNPHHANEMTYTDDRDWPSEEKSAKDPRINGNAMAVAAVMESKGLTMSASSGSSETGHRRQQPTTVPGTSSQLTPASFLEGRRLTHPHSPADDGGNDGEADNNSQGSESFAQRKERERLEEEAREAAVKRAKAEMEGPFLKAEDVDYFHKSMDTPMVKTAAGVAAAATVGCVVLGPVGLLVGAAAVGIGVGVMQIPDEQRQKLEDKATRTLRNVSDTAMSASESFSASCANSCHQAGLGDHVPDEVNNCCAAIREVPTTDKSEFSASAGPQDTGEGGFHDVHMDHTNRTLEELPKRLPPRKAGAACLRDGSFTPVYLIYTLNPGDQPRAWLDVLASAESTHDEKMEALEEIMILAKDKSRARILVEEGILDSIMWTLGRFFEKLYGPEDKMQVWTNPIITQEEQQMAKLSANCCLQLGKAYCAAMHTDGDLMLMSLYERGTVPEERQLAQMLHEVPYHSRVTKTKDPTVVDPAGEVFAVVQMSLPQAEEFAKSVKELAHGQAYQM